MREKRVGTSTYLARVGVGDTALHNENSVEDAPGLRSESMVLSDTSFSSTPSLSSNVSRWRTVEPESICLFQRQDLRARLGVAASLQSEAAYLTYLPTYSYYPLDLGTYLTCTAQMTLQREHFEGVPEGRRGSSAVPDYYMMATSFSLLTFPSTCSVGETTE